MKTTEQVGWYHEEVMQELHALHGDHGAPVLEILRLPVDVEAEEAEIAQLRWEMWVEDSSDDEE
tara:strand:- start:126 stop:317 length:192 start_codon:yes stop_codon:yes gene_type:complete